VQGGLSERVEVMLVVRVVVRELLGTARTASRVITSRRSRAELSESGAVGLQQESDNFEIDDSKQTL
jgi:hypothetical protein